MSKAERYDVMVIGSGPGGYVAAIRAAQLGQKVAIVEKSELGGVCLNWGCIPTKSLLRSAEIYHYMQHAEDFGLSAKTGFDMDAIVARSRKIAGQLSQGISFLMRKNKIDVITGFATLQAGATAPIVEVEGTFYKPKNVILATGARARQLSQLNLVANGEQVWDARHAMTPAALPKSLAVIGSGAIGMEFASFYNEFGTQVHILEMADRILPQEDADISSFVQDQMQKRDINFHLSAQLTEAKIGKNNVTLNFTQNNESHSIKVEKVLLAVGVQANTENMGLEQLGVTLEKGQIVTDAYGATNIKGLYAIGDVTAPPLLAHKASHEGVICAEKIAGLEPHPINRNQIAACTYCQPQIASIGLTEEKARAAGYEINVGRFPFRGNGKALAMGENDGIVKTIFDAATGELIGMHMAGGEVTELIQSASIAMGLESTEQELMHTIFPHPTLSEMVHESVLNAYGRALHI